MTQREERYYHLKWKYNNMLLTENEYSEFERLEDSFCPITSKGFYILGEEDIDYDRRPKMKNENLLELGIKEYLLQYNELTPEQMIDLLNKMKDASLDVAEKWLEKNT
jgi:hypothetical protein